MKYRTHWGNRFWLLKTVNHGDFLVLYLSQRWGESSALTPAAQFVRAQSQGEEIVQTGYSSVHGVQSVCRGRVQSADSRSERLRGGDTYPVLFC